MFCHSLTAGTPRASNRRCQPFHILNALVRNRHIDGGRNGSSVHGEEALGDDQQKPPSRPLLRMLTDNTSLDLTKQVTAETKVRALGTEAISKRASGLSYGLAGRGWHRQLR